MKNFIEPKLDIQNLEIEDVITTSDLSNPNEGGEDGRS